VDPIAGAADLTLLRTSILHQFLSMRWYTDDGNLSNVTFSLVESAKHLKRVSLTLFSDSIRASTLLLKLGMGDSDVNHMNSEDLWSIDL
jgi:hypothetical protein